jgi:hypothetical protein
MTANQTTATASMAIEAAPAAQGNAPWRHVGTLGKRHFVVVTPAIAADAEQLKEAAAAVCAEDRVCVVAFWSDPEAVPEAMPMSRAQQDAMVAQYLRNRSNGIDALRLMLGRRHGRQ